MIICPRLNGGFIQMKARELDSHLSPLPRKYNSLNLLDPHCTPTHIHTTYLLNLTGWRDDPENHIMYISLVAAPHLHVEDSSNKAINQRANI